MTTLVPQFDTDLALSRIGFAAKTPAPTKIAATPANKFTRAAIESASGAQLVVMLYQRLELDVTRAVTAMRAKDNGEAFTQLEHAASIVNHLRSTLDETVWDDAASLLALYQYLLESFSRAQITQDAALIEPCVPMIAELTEAWTAVAR
jgi:flagellar protein FliS